MDELTAQSSIARSQSSGAESGIKVRESGSASEFVIYICFDDQYRERLVVHGKALTILNDRPMGTPFQMFANNELTLLRGVGSLQLTNLT